MPLPLPALKPYPDYKPSGVEWLGDVPGHWDTRRTKSLLSQRSEKGFAEEPLLAATQTKGVVRKEQYENRTVMALKDLQLLKLVRVGDFVISLRSFQGGIEFAREQGIISPAYTILHVDEQKHHAFLAKLFKSRPYIENLSLHVTGIRQGQNIDYEKLARSYLPFPTLSEQTAIARFLDHVDERISRYINAKERLISLLEEQRQAVIHRTVTRGLDPNARLKPSGVEWLGDVPTHWEVSRLKSHVRNVVDQTPPDNKHSLRLALEHVESWTGRYTNGGQGVHFDSQLKQFEADDVLFGKLRPYLAKVVRPVQAGICVGEFLVLRSHESRLSASYLEQLLRSKPIIDAINSSTFGAKMPRAGWQFIGDMRQAIPPMVEQTAIVEHLEKATADIDAATSRGHHEIELLKEYRTRLIADAVTGKLDVREAASKLPEVPDELSISDKPELQSG